MLLSLVVIVVAQSTGPIDPMGQIQKRKGEKMMTTSAYKSGEDVMVTLMKRMVDGENADESGVNVVVALDGTVSYHADCYDSLSGKIRVIYPS